MSSTAGEAVAQSGTALSAPLAGFTAVPAALMAIALYCRRRYTPDGAAS
ncbi:hypothetical protein ABZO31_33505 [Streptomyces sp. HUAS MG47]